MSDKIDEKNNAEKSEVKEEEFNDLDLLSDKREEGENREEKDEEIENFEYIKNIANEPEKEDKKEDQKIAKIPQEDEIKTTKYTTNKFKTTKIEDAGNNVKIENVENEPKINFVLSSANLNYKFEDLKELAEKMPDIAEFEKRGYLEEQIDKNNYFDRIKLFIEKPKKFAFIYKSGDIICYGAKSIKESKNACDKCASIIKNCGYDIKLNKNDIKINNISGNFNFNFKINPKKYLENLKEYSKNNKNFNFKYNSEKSHQKSSISFNKKDSFPGVTLYFESGISNFFIRTFATGNTVFGGAKNEDQIKENYKKLKQLLDKSKM